MTKGNFTRDEWNHLLTLFNIGHFSSTICFCCNGEGISTRIRRRTCHSQIETYDEFNSEDAFGRVVFNFIKPGRTSYGYQDPGKSVASDDRTVKLVQPSRPDYTQEAYGRSWSSQEWKVRLRRTIDQGNLRQLFGMRCNKLPLIVKNLFSAEMRILQGTER